MDKEQVKKALDELNKEPKKKFSQSYDLMINLKNIDVKVNPVELFIALPHSKGKTVKVAAFVDQELREQANTNCDLIIEEKDFPAYKEKSAAKKLATSYDYFIAQAPLMAKVAANFGKTLGTKGKMPNPKIGCVVPPNANLELLVKGLRATVKLSAKKATNLQCVVGKESQPEEEVIENILAVYQAVVKVLPNEFQNIKSVNLKLTMSKPVRVI